jgi:hypothetical protein
LLSRAASILDDLLDWVGLFTVSNSACLMIWCSCFTWPF